MSDRSFRDRLVHIADIIDLEQLDGLVIRAEPNSADEDQPSLHRLFRGLEEVPAPNNDPFNDQGLIAHNPVEIGVVGAPDLWGLVGANRTALNRAIKEGKYELAEKLISSASDPEALNDGSMAHALYTGKGPFRDRARNFRIVKMLLEKGASPNFRNPNLLDMPSFTPFEVAVNYYLELLRHQASLRLATSVGFGYEEYDLLHTIGFNGDWLDTTDVVGQAKDLINMFLGMLLM